MKDKHTPTIKFPQTILVLTPIYSSRPEPTNLYSTERRRDNTRLERLSVTAQREYVWIGMNPIWDQQLAVSIDTTTHKHTHTRRLRLAPIAQSMT